MEKIKLSKDEIKVIKQQLNGEIEVWSATEYQQKHLTSVIDKAEALMFELKYFGQDDLIQWFYDLYLEQEKESKNKAKKGV